MASPRLRGQIGAGRGHLRPHAAPRAIGRNTAMLAKSHRRCPALREGGQTSRSRQSVGNCPGLAYRALVGR
eukprot:1973375-Heterocapsa_arctica.AAC.1